MRPRDLLRLAFEAQVRHHLRTALTLGGLAIGVTAVLILTALGEGAKAYVVNEFAGIGTNLVIVLPGKTETSGGMPTFGGTTRDLTIEDAEAVLRQAPAVRRVAPLSAGAARFTPAGAAISITDVNGLPALLVRDEGGAPAFVASIEVRDGKIDKVWATVNPDKLSSF